jgi:hypothetical protein
VTFDKSNRYTAAWRDAKNGVLLSNTGDVEDNESSQVTLFMIPLTVYGAYQVSQALYEKVRNVDYSQEQIEELDAQLKHQQFSDDDIANLNELKVNEYGQTYGPDVLGSVLVEVISDQGEIGYVYREDLEITEANTINEALQNEEVCRIKVYENDGRTEIGTFTLTDGLDFR